MFSRLLKDHFTACDAGTSSNTILRKFAYTNYLLSCLARFLLHTRFLDGVETVFNMMLRFGKSPSPPRSYWTAARISGP
jgi:hypothetical protein